MGDGGEPATVACVHGGLGRERKRDFGRGSAGRLWSWLGASHIPLVNEISLVTCMAREGMEHSLIHDSLNDRSLDDLPGAAPFLPLYYS